MSKSYSRTVGLCFHLLHFPELIIYQLLLFTSNREEVAEPNQPSLIVVSLSLCLNRLNVFNLNNIYILNDGNCNKPEEVLIAP